MKTFITRTLTTTAMLTTLALPSVAQQQNERPRSISITATSKVTNLADVATVHIGYIAYGPDKDTAYANGAKLSNTIIDTLKKDGVAADSIESQNQNIEQTQQYQLNNLSPTEKVQKAWQVAQSWTVRCTADESAKLLDVATRAGANQSGQIDWTLKDPNAAQGAAAAKALQLAQAQAQTMAAGLNVKLGVLLRASNTVESQPVRPMMRAMGLAAGAGDEARQTLEISPRKIDTTATVTAVFEIN